MIISQVMMWIAIVALALVTLTLARQIGVLHERIAPVGALKVDHGPAVGDAIAPIAITSLQGNSLVLGAPPSATKGQLLLFVSPDCPVCKNLIPIAESLAHAETLQAIYISDGDVGEMRKMIGRFSLEHSPFVNGPEIGLKFGISKLPYAMLVAAGGVLAAKGLVNSREHLESLVEAQRLGVGSVQEYLQRRASHNRNGSLVG